ERADARAIPRLLEFIADAEQLHQPRFEYLAASRRVTLALVAGDIDAVPRLREDARRVAEVYDEPDADPVDGVQCDAYDMLLAHSPGDDEITLRTVRGPSYDELMLISRALALFESGEVDQAREIARALDIDEIEARYVAGYGWLWVLAYWADLVSKLGERDMALQIEERLTPHEGACVVVAGAVSFLGSVSHYLGLLYATLGQPAKARAAFEDALAAYGRLGAHGWAERTRQAMAALESTTDAEAELRRQGPFWTLNFDGEECRVKDTKGVRDLAILLASPNREVAAAELMAQGMAEAAGADAVLDERARREFQQRLADLDADLADAEAANDLGRVGRIKDERDAIAHELAAALGLGGRARTLGDPAERARKAVSARIRDAVKAVGACHAALGDHLQASLRTGTFCSYAPASPVRWRVTDDTAR
ncbi:MAG: hypothetical protein JO176_08020, partial [Acidimicrobiia bacterium]|nr:hypothetical protein [Acidimicrobiia bacterium]